MPEKTEAQKRAQKKYIGKISRIEITVSKDTKERIAEFAERAGESISSYITTAVIRRIERE